MDSPSLPNELWQRIFAFAALSNYPEHCWTHLWTNGRRVNSTFRHNIAKTYLHTFLKTPRRCVIDFDCGWDWVPDMESGSRCAFAVEMFFDRVDGEDSRRVVFKEGQLTQGIRGKGRGAKFERVYERKKYGRWRRRIQEYLGVDDSHRAEGGGFDMTPYVISIFGASLDSESLALKFDVEKREISFEWEGMLTAFCTSLQS